MYILKYTDTRARKYYKEEKVVKIWVLMALIIVNTYFTNALQISFKPLMKTTLGCQFDNLPSGKGWQDPPKDFLQRGSPEKCFITDR